MKNHMDILCEMATSTDEVVVDTNNETATVDAIRDVTTNESKIDRGRNTSARVTNTFNERRVQEILKTVKIGSDLMEDQREQVSSLVREYADVFALSLSEVLYVDWYKYKINIDPEQVFPTKINQQLITEGQKEWFHNIHDNMEKSYVISVMNHIPPHPFAIKFHPNLIPSLPNLPPMFPPFPDTPSHCRSITHHSLLLHPSPVTSLLHHSIIIILHCQFPSLPSIIISDLFRPY